MITIKKDKNYFYSFLFLLIISYFLTIDNFSLQTAVDGGLVLSREVEFPDKFTNVTAVHFNSWLFLNHVSLILIKLNFNAFIISKIFLYISTIFFSFGIFFIVKNLTKSTFISLFLVCFTIVGKINLGNLDFPALMYFRGTYGYYALSTFTIFIGLLFNKNLKLAGFFLVLLFSIHIVVGLWVIFLFFFTILFLKFQSNLKKTFNFQDIKNLLLGMFIASIPTLFSFIEYKKNIIKKNEYNQENFNTYLNLWDHHRNIDEINYIYIFLTIILVTFYFIYLKKNQNKDNYRKFLFYLISFHCLGSLSIYLIYKMIPSYLPEIFIRAMASRVFLIHTHIGFPIIISFVYIFLTNVLNIKNTNKSFFIMISSLTILSVAIAFYKYENRSYKSNRDLKEKIYFRIDKLKKNFLNSLKPEEFEFWKKIEDLNSDGYFVTTFSSSGPTLKFGKKPYIINANYFDLVSYHPYTVDETRVILENIYGLNFNKPPVKYWPEIRDQWIIKIFENRSLEEWIALSKTYNLTGVIVPSNWKLDIKEKITSNKYTLYKLQ